MPSSPQAHKSESTHPAHALRALDRRARRRLSQSFLADPGVAEAMVRAAELQPMDRVLEIGPGLGMLTGRLLPHCAELFSVELDETLASELPRRLGSPPQLRVVQADALTVDLASLIAAPFVVVASLPYHIATPILFRLLYQRPRPTHIVTMLQDEVAQRIAARPGAMTYLGAAFSLVATARLVRRVPPGAFYPVPKVWSAIVRLDVRPDPAVPVDDTSAFLAFLRAGFTQPRKQLHNSLAQGLARPPADVQRAAQELHVDPRRRPSDLSLEEWAALYQQLGEPPAQPGTDGQLSDLTPATTPDTTSG